MKTTEEKTDYEDFLDAQVDAPDAPTDYEDFLDAQV